MTALAGYVAFGGEASVAACSAMLAAQAHYGRETRHRSDGPAALGRRLWPLLPEDAYDTGPLTGAGGRVLLCADARLDNRAELAGMVSLSDPLDRTCDAALILAAYERWGEGAFDRMVGAFAVIIWDRETRSLTLARDFMGQRPLHYHVGDGFIAVATMPKGLHALSAVPYGAHSAGMADFLALLPETGPECFFAGVSRVLPGHITVIDAQGGVRSTPYWQPPTDMLTLPDDAAYAEALRTVFDTAVSSQLRRSGGALGSHLSAGMDSSSVTATAARMINPQRLFAFTAIPSATTAEIAGGIADEGLHASATAKMHANIDHVRIQAGETSPLHGLDRHFHLYERPVLNPINAVWHDAINDAAQARGVSVMMTGQMGNMTISHGGMQRLNQLLRAGNLPALMGLIRQMRRHGHRWPGLAAQLVGPSLPPALWLWLARRFREALDFGTYSALRPTAFAALAVEQRADERGLDLSYRPWSDSKAMRLWVLGRVDLGVYYKGTLAGWGIDLRDPTADRRVIELCVRIPERQYILHGQTRALVRRAFADRLPPALLAEQRSGVQAADWALGMANAHAGIGEELEALARNPQARMLIDLERLQQAHAQWPDADHGSAATAQFYCDVMLRAVAAGHFLRKVGRTN